MNFVTQMRLFMLPSEEIDEALPKQGLIYEIGSGLGVLAAFLARKSASRKVIGLDLDSTKLRQAARLIGKNITFVRGDALHYHFKKCSGMVLSDLLHHLQPRDQEKLLEHLHGALLWGGVLVIKEANSDEKIRKWLHRLWDFILYPGDKIYYRSRGEWHKLLERLGYIVTSRSAVLWFPGSTTVFICKKKK